MDAQLSFASLDFACKKKRIKRDVFLAEMAAVCDIWLILMIGRDNLNGLAEHGTAKVLDGRFHCLHGPLPRRVLIQPGHVAQHPNLHNTI